MTVPWLDRARSHRSVARLAVRSTGRSHVGRVRTVNEDRLLDRPDRGLWAVADGMGGHSAGHAAAETAIAALATLADAAEPIAAPGIAAALGAASAAIAAGRRPGSTSGTTIVAAHLDGNQATILWAGDSRCYLLRDGDARRLTRDHSVVQDWVDAGLVASEDAERHPRANLITRALGIEPAVALDQVTERLRPGDVLLLCSDGLSRSLDARDLANVGALDACADRLLTNALQRDGSDNTTLILVAVAPEEAGAS